MTEPVPPTTPVKAIVIAAAIAAVATFLATLTSGVTFWFPEQASTVALEIDWLFNFITWICIFFFVMITILMVWFCVKYRMRHPAQKAQSDVTHNTPLELTWTIIPLILVIAMFYVGMVGYLNLRRPPVGAYEVNVTAARWSWTFQHRNGTNAPDVLLVPLNRPVKLIMQSSDVLHAVFIPAFRVKQDVVPGRVTHLWFEATKEGDYDLFCAEYCGTDHSQMHAIVRALPDDKFEEELRKQGEWYKDKPEETLYAFAQEKIYSRCKSCHSLDGKDGIGPSWRGLWAKLEAGDHVFTDDTTLKDLMGPGKMFENAEHYIEQSIRTPQQKIVMNFAGSMPSLPLKTQEIIAIRDFIKHLDEFDDQGKPKPGSPAEQIRKSPTEAAAKPQAAPATPSTETQP